MECMYVLRAYLEEIFLFSPTLLDIPECSMNNGGCMDRCVETEGSFLCLCDHKGLEVDGLNCVGT